jgi:hypothetical protein
MRRLFASLTFSDGPVAVALDPPSPSLSISCSAVQCVESSGVRDWARARSGATAPSPSPLTKDCPAIRALAASVFDDVLRLDSERLRESGANRRLSNIRCAGH